MIPTDRLLAFTLTSIALIVVPGPSVLFVIGRALVLGRRGALLTVLGNSAGLFLQVVAVAVGVGELVERSVLVFEVLKLGGAAYLVYLGVQAVRHRAALSSVLQRAESPTSHRRLLREGFVVGLSNPKSIVFFAAILPQFVDRSAGRLPLQLLLLGTEFMLLAMLLDSVWALAAGSARDWLARRPGRLAALGGTGGVLMIGIGARLALSGRHD